MSRLTIVSRPRGADAASPLDGGLVPDMLIANRHGTRFAYRQFPLWLMRILARFSEEVVYPLRYAEWYHAGGNGYDFASNADLADLERVHPLWSFERELEFWGINDLQPKARRA